MSSESKLECGTAQGSILGPLIYIKYVNDIFNYVRYNKSLTMYADDTLLIEQGESQEASIQASQRAMVEVVTGCRLNRLTINIEKTKFMKIFPNSKIGDSSGALTVSNIPLQNVHKYEYLGILLDDKLSMTLILCHIDYGDFAIDSGVELTLLKSSGRIGIILIKETFVSEF